VRELEAAAVALERRGDTGLWHFYRVFDEVATACRSGRKVSDTESRYPFCREIERLDERDVERIAGAKGPFWQHVRDAALAKQDEKSAA
jgi:hypothetical protein